MSQALPTDLSSPSCELEKALLQPLKLVARLVVPLLQQSLARQLGAALARVSRQAALPAGTPQLSALWSYATRQIFGAISGSLTRAYLKKPEPAQDSLAEHQAQGV